ncbi:uncharacterized protein LOC141620731 [Silene latifolia]|uniref:uncharacterized protein LOC141620731 n=1 Tax=Silene latifolia TaxID=37657 RepID=UPI003D784227
MSDRQKGILEAFNIATPKADIRYCVRYIWANFKLQFTGTTFKDSFWKATRAGTKAEFDFQMQGIKFLSDRAYTYLSQIGDHHWSRYAFNTNCKSNMLLNNMCEVFNHVLRECRDKPILTQMEWMRRYLMKRHYEKREGVRTYEGRVMPYVDKFLIWALKEADYCDVYASSNEKFEVEYMSKQYVVDLTAHTCSCFHWQLCGLPCQHAMASINHQRANYEDFVDEAYTREKYMQCYGLPIPPMPDITQWEKVDLAEPLPPPIRKLPGRPSHKKRRKEAGEGTSGQVPKKPRLQRTCRKCGQLGHNVKTCKNSEQAASVQSTRPNSEWTQRYRAQVEARKAKKQHDAEVLAMIAGGSQASQQQSQPNISQPSQPSQQQNQPQSQALRQRKVTKKRVNKN